MTQQVINIGAAPDDRTGDPLRTSFDKTNENFTELYAKGATEGLWNYNKTSTDTSTSPVSGRFKTNSGDYRGATQIAIHAITIQGIDRTSTLRTLLVGDLIQCQDSTNSAAWCRYSLQSLPVDHGTWFQLNVTFQADGGVASGDNQEIVFVFTASSGAAAGGNVSNSGTPTVGQYAKWVTATTIQGVAPATVLSDIGAQPAGSYQPLDGDLTAIAALAGTNTIYYRSAANTWSPVVVSTGLAFSGGNLTATVTSGAPVGAEYITSTADATLTSERVLTDTATVTWDRTTAGQIKANAVASGGGTSAPQGRLTLQTGTPVMTTTQAAKTTIYYTPYVGSLCPIYDGTNFVMSAFSELSVLTTDTTKSPAAIGASKVNDWFVWNDAGTLRIGHGPDWTNDTTRVGSTDIIRVNGIWLNNAAITNGPAASRGTYVGTTRSNTSSQLDWIFGGAAVGGTAGFFGVWNAYNRVVVQSFSADATASWTVASSSYAAHSATVRHSFVSGLAEDAFDACYNGIGQASASAFLTFGVGFDSTTAVVNATTGFIGAPSFSAEGTARMGTTALGFHFVTALEASAQGTANVYGTAGQTGYLCQSGLWFNFKM